MLRTTILIPILSLAAAAQAPAPKGDWGNLRALMGGMETRVVKTNDKAIDGRLRSVNDEGLTVDRRSGEEMIGRGSVLAVSIKAPSRRKRHMLIGLGVGAGGGLAAGAAFDAAACHPNVWFGCLLGRDFGKAYVTPLGALIGLGIGAAIPTGWREIYRMR